MRTLILPANIAKLLTKNSSLIIDYPLHMENAKISYKCDPSDTNSSRIIAETDKWVKGLDKEYRAQEYAAHLKEFGDEGMKDMYDLDVEEYVSEGHRFVFTVINVNTADVVRVESMYEYEIDMEGGFPADNPKSKTSYCNYYTSMDAGLFSAEDCAQIEQLRRNEVATAEHIKETKQLRKDIDEILQRIKNSKRSSRERSLARTKLEEAIMWLGMDLKDLGTPNPYPESKNPDSPTIEATADGLTM